MWSVFFVFLSYLDRDVVRGDFLSQALDAEKESQEMFSVIDGTFCAKMSLIGENVLYQVSDGAEVVRTVVTPAGKLVTCSVIVNQQRVRSFLQECRLGLREQRAARRRRLETRFTRMDEAKLVCQEFLQEHKGLKRSKRGFTYPGTLWCGAGNMADDYSQLGEFGDTDSCCRTHDHCPHVIHAFSSNYGYTNFKWHALCHCDCDNELKSCLRKVNDTASRVMGQAFFNVLGVPCFDFDYEEQCVERHWYGLCKKYEKLPIAVLRDSVPYDYGGIDVIDELTVAPLNSKDSKKSNEEQNQERATQSTILGHEEPSLRNVVTAAEDFIKVLATVSTSQSSTADSDKGEAETSEKKKRKNAGKKKKKTSKKHKEKGKGRKRKQKAAGGVKTEDGAAVSPAGSKAEEVLALSNFISESKGRHHSIINTNRVEDRDFEVRGKDEASNEVMKDEPAIDKETIATKSPSTVHKKPEEWNTDLLKGKISPSTSPTTTVVPQETSARRQRKGRGKKIEKNRSPSSEKLHAVENFSVVSVPTTAYLTQVAQSQQHSFTEQQLVVSTPVAPTIIPKLKRDRSKERTDRGGRKKRRKLNCASHTVSADQRQNSSVDGLNGIPHTGISTVPPVPNTERQLSHSIPDMTLSSSFSVLKRQRLKERGLRNRRRKTALFPLSDNAGFSPSISEHVSTILTTPDTQVALIHPETQSEWRLFTTATPTVRTKLHRQPTRRHRKTSKKAAALNNTEFIPKQTEKETPATLLFNAATTEDARLEEPQVSTYAAPTISRIQLSIEKAKAQYNRKKRRKAAHSNRQK
ncbi:uncharacterized protein proca1 [Cololabis saira]|uniref:uncharacterized protein proca1 n=1 Tax=Cololabis saira TaxID=129043 RepID=UPI002AD58FFE|nr:uncharacterized protein proca1 [Cololabis saira]